MAPGDEVKGLTNFKVTYDGLGKAHLECEANRTCVINRSQINDPSIFNALNNTNVKIDKNATVVDDANVQESNWNEDGQAHDDKFSFTFTDRSGYLKTPDGGTWRKGLIYGANETK